MSVSISSFPRSASRTAGAVQDSFPRWSVGTMQMRNMDNSEQRYRIIQQLQEIVRHDAPWVFGFHPKNFSLFHSWYNNLKPNSMANNRLKYTRIDTNARTEKRQAWNKPIFWPLALACLLFALMLIPAFTAYRRRAKETLQ